MGVFFKGGFQFVIKANRCSQNLEQRFGIFGAKLHIFMLYFDSSFGSKERFSA